MNRRAVRLLTLAAILIVQAFTWPPAKTNSHANRDEAAATNLIYRASAEGGDRDLFRISF